MTATPLLNAMVDSLTETVRRAGERSEADALMERYRDDPVAFAWDAFGVRLWSKQEAILRAIATNKKVAVKSGHKVGKSLLIAISAWWWAFTRKRGRVICTSSIDPQVRNIIWYEIRKLWRNRKGAFLTLPKPAELPGIGVQFGDERQILGFTTRDAEGAAGYSSDELLYLVDEASGIRESLFDAFEGNLASGGSIALFSNPTQTSGYFFDAFHRNRAEWVTFTVRSTETPNAATGREIIPQLATREWCEKRLRYWGRESARYQVRVLGEFPQQGDDAVVPRVLVQLAVERWEQTPAEGRIIGAIDVARFGSDEPVIGFKRGLRIDPLIVPTEKLDTHKLAQRFVFEAERIRNGSAVEVRVDTTGVGGGTADALRSMDLHWLTVRDMVASSSARDEKKYANLRAECWFSITEFLQGGGALPDDEELDLELGAPKYKFKGADGQQLIVEPKDEIKKRIGRSPDRADCVSMLTWGADMEPFDDWGSDNDSAEEGDEWTSTGTDDGYRWGPGRGFG